MKKVIESLHTADGLYCVDVVERPDGYVLCACRRDEGRWQVMEWHEKPAYATREAATAAAARRVRTF